MRTQPHPALFSVFAVNYGYGLNNPTPAGRLPRWRWPKPPRRWSAVHSLANLRPEIAEYETLQSPTCRTRKRRQFVADAIGGHFGKNFPITARALLTHPWT